MSGTAIREEVTDARGYASVIFQEGPVTAGVNGCSVSDVLQICLDELKKQQTQKPKEQVKMAISKVELALAWLGNDDELEKHD